MKIIWTTLALAAALNATGQEIRDMRCEYLENPLGIDTYSPRLGWRLDASQDGAGQTAFRVIVGTDSLRVAQGEGDTWDSKTVESDQITTRYAGKELTPFTPYYWKVIVRDQTGKNIESPVARFETGMMSVSNWQGAWISDGHDPEYKPAPYFRKAFDTGKPIRSARAYIAVAGLYELYINGERIGDHRLDPAFTRFDKRTLYVTYDVTQQLQQGANAIGVILGNGWYNHQSKAVWDFDKAGWRNRPTFCMDLRIEYEDGSEAVISTDRSWKTADGPLRLNSIYTAEHYDYRLEQPDWCQPGFDDGKWSNASFRQAPAEKIVAQQLRPIRTIETLQPVNVRQIDDTTYVYDFGRNFAGITHLKMKAGWKNGLVRLKHGERLYDNGRVDLSNIDVYFKGGADDPFQTDLITLAEGQAVDFCPKFNYKGFRYVEVTTNRPYEMKPENLTAYVTHSDVPQTGLIHSSDSLINRIWAAGLAAYTSNLMGYPTHCPQREKNGWTGDGHFAIETGLYNYDGITIYEKWLADHQDEQQPNGVLPDIIPTWGWGYGTDNGTDWTSTIALIPWNLYLFYGDHHALESCYNNIKRYVDYVDRISVDHLTTFGRGDWVPVRSKSSKELTSSVYFYVDAQILAKAAQLFGKTDDHNHYSQLAEQIKQAINEKYLDEEKGLYASGTQTELSVPLYLGIVPDQAKAKVAQNLAEMVKADNYHLDVGVLGTKAILNALSANGYDEIAYRLATQDSYPSWGWWIKNGATTFLENWDLKATRDISDNHIMFAEVVAWLHKGLGGIYPDERQPGFKHTLLRPYFPTDLKSFTASHKSPYGEIISSWEKRGKRINYQVTIPAGCSATLTIPENIRSDQKTIDLTSGTHTFQFREK